MTELAFREALPADAIKVAAGLRKADREELHASGFVDADRALLRLVAQSEYARAVVVDGEVLMLFGVQSRSLLAREGLVWAVAAEGMFPAHRRVLLDHAPRYEQHMLRLFPRISNHVHARNRTAVRWLHFMGFQFGDTIEHHVTGEPFSPFWKEAA